jgi:hypothetical protein
MEEDQLLHAWASRLMNARRLFGTTGPKGREGPDIIAQANAPGDARRSSVGQIPIATSAQCSTGLLLRNAMTPGSIVAGRSCGSTAVATTMSQRSLKATDSADRPGGLRAVRA